MYIVISSLLSPVTLWKYTDLQLLIRLSFPILCFLSCFHPALKIKVKEIFYLNGDTKIVPENKSKTIYKLNGVMDRDLKKTVLWLKDGMQCICEEMNDIHAAYLVMGQKVDGRLVITSLKRWQKGQREFKRISRSIRKLQC